MRIHQHRQLGLAEHIDEPRRHGQPTRINVPPARRRRNPADRGNPPALNGYVARIPGRAGPVDNVTVPNHEVVRLCERDQAEQKD